MKRAHAKWLWVTPAALGGAWLVTRLVARHLVIDALARMLIAETDFAHESAEMVQIVFVALNRAKTYGKRVVDVVTPPGSPVWNATESYRTRFYAADKHPKWSRAKAFVAAVVDGRCKCINDGSLSFFHPVGLATPPCGEGYVAQTTVAGQRCVPTWAQDGHTVGQAVFV